MIQFVGRAFFLRFSFCFRVSFCSPGRAATVGALYDVVLFFFFIDSLFFWVRLEREKQRERERRRGDTLAAVKRNGKKKFRTAAPSAGGSRLQSRRSRERNEKKTQ